MYWLSGYSYRKKIKIDHTKITEAYGGYFPMAVLLNSSNFDFSKARSDGYDIRFVNFNGLSTLSYERVSHSSNDLLAEYWVKVPAISNVFDTHFYIYYGNESATDVSDPESVWYDSKYDMNYAMILHMNDATTSTVLDSTLNNNDGTKYGANQPTQASGVVGMAQDFDGINDYINCGSSSTLDDIVAKTISFRVELNSYSGANPTDGSHYVNKGTWSIGTDVTNSRNFFGHNFSTTVGRWHFPQFSLNAPHHVVVLYDRSSVANNPTVYVDGVSQTVTEYSTPVGTASSDAGYDLYISRDLSNDRWVDGIVDEVCISNAVRGVPWVELMYHSGNDNILNYQTEEAFDPLVTLETPIVKSVEFIEYTMSTTTVSGSVNLSKGQNYANCVPFLSMYGAVDYVDNHMIDTWFTGTTASGAINFQRAIHRSSDLYVKVFVVEFDPAEVYVQQGIFGDNLPAGTTDYTTASGFVQNRTAMMHYWSSSSTSLVWRDHLVKGAVLSNGTQVSFNLNVSSGTIKGHYFLFSALNNQFEVEHVDASIVGVTNSFVNLSKVYDPLKTFFISSYSCSDGTAGQHDDQLARAIMYHHGRIYVDRGGAVGNVYFSAQVIQFLDSKVHVPLNGWFSITTGATTTDISWSTAGYSVIPADLDYSMAIFPHVYNKYALSVTAADLDAMFVSIKFLTANSIQLQRSASVSTTVQPAILIVDWLGYTVTGINTSPLDPTKSFVKSVENVRLSSSAIMTPLALTKGQNISNCTVFTSNYNSGAAEQQRQHMSEVFLSDTGMLCKHNLSSVANSIVDASVVEFYPDQVKVWSGREYWPSGTSTLNVTLSGTIQTDRAFVLAKWMTDSTSTSWSEHLIRFRTTSTTNVEFYKYGTTTNMSVSWFVVEDLGNNFRTEHSTGTVVSSAYLIASLNNTCSFYNSFRLLSYATNQANTNISYVGLRTYALYDFVHSYFEVTTGTGDKYVAVTAVRFIGERNVQRTQETGFDFGTTDSSKTAIYPSAFQEHSNALTVFNYNLESIGRCTATTTNPIDNAFSSMQITDYETRTITATRQATGYANWTRGVVICWDGADFTTSSTLGQNYSVKTKSLVQSIESVTFNHTSGYQVRFLTKGQDSKQCVPFCSWKISQASNFIGRCLNNVYFENNARYPARLVYHTGNWSADAKEVQCYIVEFDVNQVKVQHGTITMSYTATSQTVTIEEVDLTKAFLIFYTSSETNDNIVWTYFTVCGKFTDSTTLTFYRQSASAGYLSISYFVVECLQDQWYVRHSQATPGTAATSYTISRGKHDNADKTLILASWTGGSTSDNCSESLLRVSDRPVHIDILFDKSSAVGTIYHINAEIIEFKDESIRCFGNMHYFASTTSVIDKRGLYTDQPLDLTRSIVMPTNNLQRNESSTPEDIDNAFVEYFLSDGSTVVGLRQNDTSDTNGSFYTVEFPPYKTHYIDGFVKEQGAPVERTVRAYRSDTGEVMDETTSVSGTGYFWLETTYSGSHYVVCLDDLGGINYNDLIYGRIYPTLISGTFAYNAGLINYTNSDKGYSIGGYVGISIGSIEDLVFTTETSKPIMAKLSSDRHGSEGVNSSTKGYTMGGNTTNVVNTIDALTFTDEIDVVIAATLNTARYYIGGVNSSTKGYAMGGCTSGLTTVFSMIDGLNFSTETSEVISATTISGAAGASVSSSTKGYVMGGYTTTNATLITSLTFDSETTSVLSATINTARRYGAGINSSTKGYCVGGYTTVSVDIIDDLDFSTEVSETLSVILSVAKQRGCGVNSSTKGYDVGGYTTVRVTTIDDFTFNTEVSVPITATLYLAKWVGAGVQSGGYL